MANNDSKQSLDLVIAGLFGPAPATSAALTEGVRLPALETMLARSDHPGDISPSGLEAVLFALFGVDIGTDEDLPVAAVTRVLDLGVIDKGWWLRADPVHLRPEHDRLILFDNKLLQIAQAEADGLAAEIMEVYAADGWLLKAPRPSRWYLKPPRASRIGTTPLPDVIGKDIHPYLPHGKDGKTWHTILNEIQIMLHTAGVNTERERRGKPPVNSLWFWGSGRLPRIRPVSWAQVWSQEPVSLALARLSETTSAGVPAGFPEWARQAARPGAHLVVLEESRGAVAYGEAGEWLEFMRKLERDWMAPMLEALKGGQLERVTIHTDTGRRLTITPVGARRWWRRSRSLETFR